MKIAVIGGSGWFGSHIIPELLRRGVEVVNLDLVTGPDAQGVEFRRVDITEPVTLMSALRESKANRVIHLASQLGKPAQAEPYTAYRVNIGGSANILEISRQLGIERVVAASSASIYGGVEGTSLREDMPRRPTTVYGMTKLALEHLGVTYMRQYGLQFVALRPTYGYGPGWTKGDRKDYELIERALRGEPVLVRGDSPPYEPVYVADTARAFVAAALVEKLTHAAFNVGIGKQISLVETAEIVKRHVPKARLQIEPAGAEAGSHRARASQPPLDVTAAREELGWEPRYMPEQGYAELIELMRRE